jgi:dolichol kinase
VLTGPMIMLAAYAAVFAAAEYLRRRGWSALMTRKFGHAAGGLVSCALPLFVSRAAAITIGIGVSLLLAATARSRLLRSLHEGGSAGVVLFPAGLALCAFFFWRADAAVFQWSALLLGLADGAAGAAGGLWGKRSYSITGRKTAEGSVFCFAAALAVFLAFVFAQKGFIGVGDAALAAAGALAVTAVEGALGKGWDNVAVPLAGGAVLLLLKQGSSWF